ncbi:rootletin-like [Culicoides brevitarsis]|uniref:rootletin-like n=1 Tax=Culicoides brevitarsis TaxID=469753 RepID=UPI00307B6FA3
MVIVGRQGTTNNLKRMSGISKLDSSFLRRKITSNNSYTDYAYREAMNRLKNLLSEPYTPSAQLTTIYQRPIYESSFAASDTSHHDHHTFPGRPSLKELSKYFPGTNIVRATCYSAPNHSTDKPIIHELPSGSCNVASSSHCAPVSTSNDANHQELLRFIERQENYIKQMERESDTNREELSSLKFKVQELMHENENLQRMDSDSERDFGKSSTVVMLESKVADLEAKLSQEKLDVKRLKEENENLRSKIATGAGLEIVETYKRKCDELMRDKNRLQDDVKRLEHKIEHMRTYESNLYSKNLRDRDFGEKTFDKSQLEIEVRRLKEDLEYQKERYESLQQEMTRRIAEEREAALRGCTHHKFDHHTSSDDIGAKWEYTSKLQFEIDRHKRVEADLKREISQKNLYIDDLKAEYRHKIKNFQSEINELHAIRDTLESENNHLKLQLERQDRQAQVEATRLNNETASLRSRLDRADTDLMHARREQLRLNEQISALEKELAISDATRDTNNRPELSRIISDMEHKHASTVNELEGMITSQKELMEKLTAECKTLTHKLEDTTLKHKEETKSLRQTNIELMDRLKQLWECYKSINPVFDPVAAAASSTDTPSLTSTTINPETQHNHITPYSDIITKPCMTAASLLANSNQNHDQHPESSSNKFLIASSNETVEDISSIQSNLQTLSNKLTTNPSITSAPSSLLAQSNILSSLNLTSNLNNSNNNVSQDKSKIDNLYDSIISTTVDNMSSLSHSLTNQLSAIKDTYSLPMTFSNVNSSSNFELSNAQDVVKEPTTFEAPAARSIVEQSPRKATKSPLKRIESQSSIRAPSPARETLQRFKSTESIQSATGFEKPYSKQEEYGGMEKRDTHDVAFEDGSVSIKNVVGRRGSKSRAELDRRYESPTRKDVAKTYDAGQDYSQGQQFYTQQPQQQQQQPDYGYEKAEDDSNNNNSNSISLKNSKNNSKRYGYEQQPQYQQATSQGYISDQIPQQSGYQIDQNEQQHQQQQQQQYQEPRYENVSSQEQQYRSDYGGEQQQQQFHQQQYREPEYTQQQVQMQPEQQIQQQQYIPEYEHQQQYQQPEMSQQQQYQQPEMSQQQQYQQQQNVPQSPRTYAQQNMSPMPSSALASQYTDFVDTSGYVESRQSRDAEGTMYAAPTGSIRDSPTLDRARQSPTSFRQQSPIGGSPVIALQQKQPSPQKEVVIAPTPIAATIAKKSPSPPATTEVVPPVTQINQTIRKEVTAPTTSTAARRGTRPPTLRSVNARTRAAAASARGGNR